MASNTIKRLPISHYGAIIRDSTNQPWIDGPLPFRKVQDSTSTLLKDPKTKEELLILGTCNMSTRLAHRNLRLAEQFQPTSVLLQVSQNFKQASEGSFRDSDALYSALEKSGYVQFLNSLFYPGFSVRNSVLLIRHTLMSYWFHSVLRTPSDFGKLFVPGLDYKLVLDLAEQKKLNVLFAGEEFGGTYIQQVLRENGPYVFKTALQYLLTYNNAWKTEIRDMGRRLRLTDLRDLTENYFNKDVLAWWVRLAELIVPEHKAELVDHRAEKLLTDIEQKMQGPKKLVVVNQWHMDQVERLWRLNHGISVDRPPTSGTEDMPLGAIQAYIKGMKLDRKKTEEITGTPMALPHDFQIVPYHDQNRSHCA